MGFQANGLFEFLLKRVERYQFGTKCEFDMHTIVSGVFFLSLHFKPKLSSFSKYIFDIAKAGGSPSDADDTANALTDVQIMSAEVKTLYDSNLLLNPPVVTEYHEFYDPFEATPAAGVNFYSVDSTSGTNVYFRRRCGYRPCPSWSEWRSAYEKGTWGYE